MRMCRVVLAVLSCSGIANAQRADALAPEVRKFVRIGTPKIILEHVRIIDGTGAAPTADRNIVIENGKITAISAGADRSPGDGTTILDLRGDSVTPGIVGMHDHLYYQARPHFDAEGSFERPMVRQEMTFSAPRLYLANGVTTIRTTGSAGPYVDIALAKAIESGARPGPRMDVTGPYLNGLEDLNSRLPGPEEARQTVDYWADRGVTSFKAYVHITREELAAVIQEAHKRGLKVTGHLCSVTYREAVALGIDNFEHGFFVNTELDPDKKPDLCTSSRGDYTLEHTIPGTPQADSLIALLVQHHVAVTSTLSGLSASLRPVDRPAVLDAMSPHARETYMLSRNLPVDKAKQATNAFLLRREMDMERAFVAAGGLLLAGPDPVGFNGNIPGFGDQREIELLVDAGFTPVEAIRIATLNGATFLGRQDRIGSIAPGKNADLLVVKGDPSTRIADIENVEIVFKDGVGYDPQKLLDSAKGHYGEY